MNNLQAVNLAASRIGIGVQHRASALSDRSELAEAANEILQHTLDVMVSQYAWPFARASKAMVASSVAVPSGYGYAYQKPSNALVIHFVEYDGFMPDWLSINDHRGQWRIYANPDEDGQIVVSQQDAAWVWFTKQITDVTYTTPLFADAFAWKMASELALAMKADPRLAASAAEMAIATESAAVAQAHNEAGGMIRLQTEAEAVRCYGGRDPAPWLPGHGRFR